VLAVAYWESGFKQASRSKTGAIGLMQIEPYTAATAGPALLHRRVNLNNPVDNAELGAALLRSYLDQLHDPKLALAAYYQGLTGVRKHGIYRSSRSYVDGIWRLRNRLQAGWIP
jgi:soluble lytic murein transglycosylase-like protein